MRQGGLWSAQLPASWSGCLLLRSGFSCGRLALLSAVPFPSTAGSRRDITGALPPMKQPKKAPPPPEERPSIVVIVVKGTHHVFEVRGSALIKVNILHVIGVR